MDKIFITRFQKRFNSAQSSVDESLKELKPSNILYANNKELVVYISNGFR
jgi:hypothetical protein